MATSKIILAQPCRIRVARDAFEFEAEGTREFVLEMIQRFVPESAKEFPKSSQMNLPSSKDKKTGSIPANLPDKGISVREFIHQMESRKHIDLVLAFGYYLEKYSGQPAFTPADLNNLYYEAKLDTSNTSQMIIHSIKRGFMMEKKKGEDGGKRKYTVTHSGEKYIEGLLAANPA